jgi:hypothetical protein
MKNEMAKNKNNTINTLEPKKFLLDRMMHGRCGRFGIMSKLWKDLSKDELAEIYLSSHKSSNDAHFMGTLHNYVSPFDKPFPTIDNDNEE